MRSSPKSGGSSMQVERADAEARAIDWLVRQRDPDFADWDGFADWLAEDGAHAAIYDAVASFDLELDALPPSPAPSVAITPARHHPSRRRWFGGAMAAALVGTIRLSSLGLFGDDSRIETLAGEHRSITLADGSKIEINGASVVEIDKD